MKNNVFLAELTTQLASPKYEIRVVPDTFNVSCYGRNTRHAKLHKIWHMTMRRDVRHLMTEMWCGVVSLSCVASASRNVEINIIMRKCCVAMLFQGWCTILKATLERSGLNSTQHSKCDVTYDILRKRRSMSRVVLYHECSMRSYIQ